MSQTIEINFIYIKRRPFDKSGFQQDSQPIQIKIQVNKKHWILINCTYRSWHNLTLIYKSKEIEHKPKLSERRIKINKIQTIIKTIHELKPNLKSPWWHWETLVTKIVLCI